jgi:hypothetical protein
MKPLIYMSLFFGLLLSGCSVQDKVENHQLNETVTSVVEKITFGAESDTEKMERIYYFVRDEIKFGWVHPQEIPAGEVLKNKKGVCMQKANLLVAMAREAGIKARFHFMYVHKTALEDFLPEFAYNRWVDPFPHTFPEVYLNGRWVSMEPTFDKELHEICLNNKLNFGKYKEIAENVSIDFSVDGVKGHQQFVFANEKDSFYGDDLSLFKEYMDVDVPWWKKMLQPFIFSKAQRIMEELRHNYKKQT